MNIFLDFFYKQFTLFAIETAVKYKKLRLNLSNSQIEELPDVLKHCQNLSKLYLHKNKIQSIPATIVENLKHLRVLSLNQNMLNEFPVEICKLKLLSHLNISNNNIKTLPPEIGGLEFLTILWCNNTGLEIISPEIGFCTKLDTFGARNNKLTELPESFRALKALRWLTLEGNQIQSVSNCLGHLIKLVHLNLKKNRLQTLPVELEKLKRLRYCYLQYNSIGHIKVSNIVRTKFMIMLKLEHNLFNANMLDFDVTAFPHVTFVDNSENIMDAFFDDLDGQEEWEHSVDTTHLNSLESTDDDIDLENISITNIPEVLRFFSGFN